MTQNILMPTSALAFLMLFSVSVEAGKYPSHWWKPVDPKTAPKWEILPQEAKKGVEVILSKRNELGLLSNFAHTPFTYRGKSYESIEGFWQMMKYPESKRDTRHRYPGWEFTRAEVSQMVAFDAKRAGKTGSRAMKELNIDWVSFEGKRFPYRAGKQAPHYKIIREVTLAKVKQNPKVRRLLLKTGDLILRPDHHQKPNTPPAWKYFEIYTEIRKILKKRRKR